MSLKDNPHASGSIVIRKRVKRRKGVPLRTSILGALHLRPGSFCSSSQPLISWIFFLCITRSAVVWGL